ncbi:acyltransferase family protein [Aeromicrobium sp.]|uniref:acyltransferase family protein n=1 Tax=Aeromicrobium sp. TaxID=1871063 RepID=UPI0019AFB318|nr:acyltransferase family protein [Aeromicrobium sp.]MBC7632440.1 acyltransferase [Aeromicrobium sp.]
MTRQWYVRATASAHFAFAPQLCPSDVSIVSKVTVLKPFVPRGLRRDIQGLRAMAVTLVVVYHLWPTRLSGGFIGVDVFFVISGFLITAHLLGHVPTRGSDLVAFWARRIRRLLPASLTVLAATLVGTCLFLPETQWRTTADQARAAALYVINWRLSSDAVDYLAADNTATPVQHFWSLSVEEQFYGFWPILLLVLGLLGAAVGARRAVIGVGLAVVVATSFVYSVVHTASVPADAYFNTGTRMWELGAGGLLAFCVAGSGTGTGGGTRRTVSRGRWRAAVAWAGLALVAATAVLYSDATPFPGWQAALPVLGTVAVIAAQAPDSGLSPTRVAAWRPVQGLGDISYSVYLWHWPLIVLWPYAFNSTRGTFDNLAIIAATLVLATLTKRLVEDRFRTTAWSSRTGRTYGWAVISMAVVVAAALTVSTVTEHRSDQDIKRTAALLAAHDPCVGASVADHPHCPASTFDDLVRGPAAASSDMSDAYRGASDGKSCFAAASGFRSIPCTFGDPDGTLDVALVGNSHGGQWLPALEAIAATRHWRIHTYLASACAINETPQVFNPPAGTDGCLKWSRRTTKEVVRDAPDLVIVAASVARKAEGTASLEAGASQFKRGALPVLRSWRNAGLKVAVIRDTPSPQKFNVPDCVATHPSSFDSDCSGAAADWLHPDPLAAAARALDDPHVRVVDLTPHICPDGTCRPVIGNVIGWFDGSHLSATFSSTLGPYLFRALAEAGLVD